MCSASVVKAQAGYKLQLLFPQLMKSRVTLAATFQKPPTVLGKASMGILLKLSRAKCFLLYIVANARSRSALTCELLHDIIRTSGTYEKQSSWFWGRCPVPSLLWSKQSCFPVTASKACCGWQPPLGDLQLPPQNRKVYLPQASGPQSPQGLTGQGNL